MVYFLFLLLVPAEPRFTLTPESVTTKTGARVTLECEADGNPLPHIWWKRNGQPLSETNRIYLSDDDIELTIEHIKESDSGEFGGGGGCPHFFYYVRVGGSSEQVFSLLLLHFPVAL